MEKMNRSTFLKLSTIGLVGTTHPGSLLRAALTDQVPVQDDSLLKRAVETNDQAVERWVGSLPRYQERRYLRPFSNAFATYTASFCHPDSSHYTSPSLLERMSNTLDTLFNHQYENGTLDSGGNRQSPPDTAFYLEKMCPAATVLEQANIAATDPVQQKLRSFLEKAGEGIRTGGVHTPNHRWVVSSVLAHLYSIFQDEKYLHRLEEWLSEGIYQNEDGNYPERSRNYSIVENRAFITIGRLLGRPQFFDIAKKNLESNFYYMERNGDLVTLDSRRQDQNYNLDMTRYYFQYKYLAHHYQDPFLGAITNEMEGLKGFDQYVLSNLITFMEEPVLLSPVPATAPLPSEYTRVFPGSDLVRIKREAITASIFGGNDKPLVIASGQSNNPTFFTFRKGEAILHSIRLSTTFFNTGYVRPDGVIKEGNRYTLKETKEAYYYHPFPADKRNAQGDYALSPSLDGRFWSKMDFEQRPKDTLTLNSSIHITEEDGVFTMDIEVDGPPDVAVIVEFRFNHGGQLEGVTPAISEDDYFLSQGTATYTVGDDRIEIGPGIQAHNSLRGLDGEVYTSHFGSIKGEGMHVYMTGLTPFKHSLTVR